MRFLKHSLIGLFLMSMTLGLLAYAGHMVFSALETRMSREPNIPARRERVFAANLITAHEQTIIPVLTAFGTVQSRRSLEIRANSAGTLTMLADNFQEGGQVAAGQLLAQVDPADARAALARAESDIMDARAEGRDAARALALARDELGAAQAQADLQTRALRRQQDLEQRGVGTAAAVEAAELAAAASDQAVLSRRQALAGAEARVDQAATRLARARIALAESQRRLDETAITARFDGQLSDVTVVEGGLVSPNERLATLVDAAALEVAFRVSTPQYARLIDAEGALMDADLSATLEAFGIDLVAQGRVSRAGAMVGEGQTGRLVFAQLDNAQGLKPGDFVTVSVQEPPLERVVRLPSAALAADGTVLVLGEDDRLEALAVTMLRRQGDDILVRGAGLEGREVVAKRAPVLGAGIKVRPVRQGANASNASDATSDDSASLLELSDDRRARLVAFVRNNPTMPESVKARLIGELEQKQVPARMVQRLETRMGG